MILSNLYHAERPVAPRSATTWPPTGKTGAIRTSDASIRGPGSPAGLVAS